MKCFSRSSHLVGQRPCGTDIAKMHGGAKGRVVGTPEPINETDAWPVAFALVPDGLRAKRAVLSSDAKCAGHGSG